MIKLIAVLCSLANPVDCHEETVTTSDVTETLNVISCQVGEASLVEWLKLRPQYRLIKWKCQIGDRKEKAA